MERSKKKCKFIVSLDLFFFSKILLVFVLIGCNSNPSELDSFNLNKNEDVGSSVYGQTQGTTYVVMCNDRIEIEKKEIEDLLNQFDQALSTYIDNSIVSRFNQSPSGAFYYIDSLNYFNDCLKLSRIVYNKTNGAFDPSVYPLLEIWGFFKNFSDIPDSIAVENVLKNVSFEDKYHFMFMPSNTSGELSKITKRTSNFKLVFNAIAQGQAVDVICNYLERKGARNYFVEIGGEVKVKGVNDQGKIWTIGIDKPIENSNKQNRELINIIELENKSVATSGNYRQFYEKNGVKYSHTLNPKTGYPVNHHLLSATVVTNSCALADAYATAFMVMGPKKSIDFIEDNPELDLDIFLIFNDNQGVMKTYGTPGFNQIIKP
ncbi:MAG: FAD:protein FMN transferase [Crocinitomicaceae bacterium]